MSDKRKIKQKRKRGYSGTSIDFISPLAPEECIQRLEASPSPLDDYQEIKVIETNGAYQISLRKKSETAPIWFMGRLETVPEGTRIHGDLCHSRQSFADDISILRIMALWGFSAVAMVVLGAIHLFSTQMVIVYFYVTLVLLAPVLIAFPLSPKSRQQVSEYAPPISQWLYSELER
jgi:hypothetical protein